MVSLTPSNIYQIRSYILSAAIKDSDGDCLRQAFLSYLGLLPSTEVLQSADKLYQRSAISGFTSLHNQEDLSRLLGQSSFVDSVPRPWVADILVVLGVKWAVDHTGRTDISSKFSGWVNEFLPQRIRDGRLTPQEKALADYILSNQLNHPSNGCVALFLHYKGVCPILDQEYKKKYIQEFLEEFKLSYKSAIPALTSALFIYVLDSINNEAAALPPNLWSTDDVITFLENIPAGLKRWTWEEKPKTKNSTAVKWHVENEYHVQNLLYLMLAPIFPDVSDEIHTAPVGQKNPRLDLYLPSMDTVIEVKYRKDSKKSFQDLIGEIAEDVSLYRSDPKFKKSKLIVFMWDHTRATEEHVKFKEGVMKLEGINGCIEVCSPSVMNLYNGSISND